MSETKLATVRFGIRPDVIDDTEIQNLIESYHREYINLPLSRARWFSHITHTVKYIFFENQVFFSVFHRVTSKRISLVLHIIISSSIRQNFQIFSNITPP